MKIKSLVFEQNNPIPRKYSGEGENINPPLEISDAPNESKSLALIVDDPDAPMGTFTHWLLWNIDPKTSLISERELPPQAKEGVNSAGKVGYIGPYPPSGTHHYHFKLYALSKILTLAEDVSKDNLEKEISANLIEKAELVGTYTRNP